MNEDLQDGEPAGPGEEGELAIQSHPAREEEEEEGDEPGGLHGVHAGAHFVDVEDLEVGAHPPIGEGWFVEAILVVKVGHDPLAAIYHLDGGMGEAGFVAVNERQGPDARDEGHDGQQGETQWRKKAVDESRFIQGFGLKRGGRV